MNWKGLWRNQNGSELTIDSVEGNELTGVFESKKGRAVQGQRYDVRGTINGEVAGFIVDFGEIGSIVNFSGRLADDGTLHTLWVLTREFSDDEKTKKTQPWNSFTVNSDIFSKIS